ncbi:MAG TPA: DUF2147 domain-containing protein [Pseudolabrys sp.]|nr:DUF2147 domain-containing protein [Pseudolabrys sp.]
MRLSRMFVLTAALIVSSTMACATEPTGTWLTQKGDARIRVARCGKALCGTIVWIKDAVDPQTGKPPLDDQNPDPAKRNRRIVGLRIFTMVADAQGGWSGSIYNSDNGQTYTGKLLMRGADELQINGCAGAFCGGEAWRRVGK